MADKKADLIKVKKAVDDGKVAIWESNERHPKGEIFIANTKGAHEVAQTPAVMRAISEGKLEQVGGPKKKAASSSDDDETGDDDK